MAHVMYRMNSAAGPYQMFGGTLLEGIVFDAESPRDCSTVDSSRGGGRDSAQSAEDPHAGVAATYYEELPPSQFHQPHKHAVRVAWFFQYGETFHGPRSLSHSHTLAHPHTPHSLTPIT